VAVIFFDGDQTLWDFQALMRRTLAATIKELRRQEPTVEGDLSVEAFVADREAAADQLRGKVTNLESIRLAAFTRSLWRLGIPDARLAEHLNDYYLQRRFAGVDLYDEVLPVLETLIRDHTVGLLSNGNSYPERVGLERFFTATVFSQDHGRGEAGPAHLRDRAGGNPRRRVHHGRRLNYQRRRRCPARRLERNLAQSRPTGPLPQASARTRSSLTCTSYRR
jgi:phosphoglycolate phosphatase-like HAD superfamily hydrolase